MYGRRSSATKKEKEAEDLARRRDLLNGASRGAQVGKTETRTVEDMQAEIDNVKAETGASLDRSLAVLQSTQSTAANTNESLAKQSQQLHEVRGTLAKTDQTLNDTDYKLKYKFSWAGTIKGAFTRGPKASAEAEAFAAQPPPPPPPARGKGGGGCGSSSSSPTRSGFGGGGSNGGNGKRRSGGSTAPSYGPRAGGTAPAPAPRGGATAEYDGQLDAIDKALEDLKRQAEQANAQLAQQQGAIDAVAQSEDVVAGKVASQSTQIRRRWKIT